MPDEVRHDEEVLMYRPGHLGRAQHFDRSLHLPPVAEMDDVAERAASAGALRRFRLCMLAEARDQVGRFGERRPVLNVNVYLGVTVQSFPASLFIPAPS